MEELDNLVELSPAWKQAVITFLNSNFEEGSILTHDWLWQNFRLEKPNETTKHGEARKVELVFLQHFKRFEEALLKDHQTHLYSKFAVGYEIVKVSEQTYYAENEGRKDFSRALVKMSQRLVHVDLKRLNQKERQENADALARCAQLSGMMKQLRKSSNAMKELREQAE